MRLFLLALLAGVLAGCSKGDALKTAALKVEIHYEGFRPGCVTLTVTDQAEVSRHVTTNVNVPTTPAPGTLSVAVFRQAGWSHDVRLLAAAKEQNCDGAQVVTAETTASLANDGITSVDLSLSALDKDGDGFVASTHGGTDCNDDDASVGGPRSWYVDADGDEYGSGILGPQPPACQAPSFNSARNGDDCNDNDSQVHPGQEEFRCDGRDDNCNGVVDETFAVGGTCLTTDTQCQGVNSCNGTNGVVCVSTTAPTPYYVDTDGDGKAGTEMGRTCGSIPTNTTREFADCDESSPFRAQGMTEVCDRIDNDCSGVADDGLACSMNWQAYSGTDSTSWKAAATDGTTRIWLAGDGGKLARSQMDFSGGTQVTCDGDWKAAWVAASGELFLAGGKGSNGRFARATSSAGSCTTENNNVNQVMNGLVGIENSSGAPTLYGVTGGGRIFRWTPPAAPEQMQSTVDASLRAVSAASGPETLLAVGSKSEGIVPTLKPRAFRFDTVGSTWVREDLPDGLEGELRDVHVVNANYAYAVGDNGMALERVNGVWSAMKPVPPAYSSRSLQDVLAFGKTAVYVATTDGGGAGGAVLFFNGSEWSTVYTDAKAPTRALRSLGGKIPTGIVTAGDGGAAAAFVVAR